MAHHSYPICIEECSRDVRCGDERANFERIIVPVFTQFSLKAFVIKVTILGHGDEDNVSTCLSPWYQIGVVLEYREKDYGLFSIHLIAVLKIFQVKFVDF